MSECISMRQFHCDTPYLVLLSLSSCAHVLHVQLTPSYMCAHVLHVQLILVVFLQVTQREDNLTRQLEAMKELGLTKM